MNTFVIARSIRRGGIAEIEVYSVSAEMWGSALIYP